MVVVVWKGWTSVVGVRFAQGHVEGTEEGGSHKMHAFKEGLAHRSAGDT